MSPALIERYDAVILDMDGVLYLRFQAIEGAREVMGYLNDRSIPFVLMTNNSSNSPTRYVERLRDIGMESSEDNIVTSSVATAEYMTANYDIEGKSVYVVGEDSLKYELKDIGLRILDSDDDSKPDFVVVGWDGGFTYGKLKRATIALRSGAKFLATNPDTTYPTPEGLWPGAGAILASVIAGSGAEPTIIGKPNTLMVEISIKRMGVDPSSVLMVGDRLDTDIVAGIDYGIDTLLVLTGVSTVDDIERTGIKPSYVSDSVSDLLSSEENAFRRI